MLRFYTKTERLTERADNSEPATMSNYHIKTLMLWTCELKPRSWWTENLNLVRICVELLHTLSVWFIHTCCPHYFINNCNLLDVSLSDGATTSKLMSIDETYLSTWLVNNYVRQCAQLCPPYIIRLFDDVSSSMKLQNAVSEIAGWRLNNSLIDQWDAVEFAEMHIPLIMSSFSVNVQSCFYWINELSKIHECFSAYFSAVALLYVARKLLVNGFSDKLMDILATVCRRNFSHCCSVLSLHKPTCKLNVSYSELVVLLQKYAVEHLTTYCQLVARDFGSVVTIVTTDFEALYAYKHGDYQRCLQLSTPNVHTLFKGLFHGFRMSSVTTLSVFIQLLDDDIVSLIALTLIVNRNCTDESNNVTISQLTLSLYLMTQCQLKLHHSVTSLAQTLHYIKVAQRTHPRERTLDQLMLKLIEHKINSSAWTV